MNQELVSKNSGSDPFKNNDNENHNFRSFIYIIFFLVFLFAGLFNMPMDDGLRHIGLASVDYKSWGEVYPFSRFQESSGISPWFGFDLSLRYLFKIFDFFKITPLVSKFLLLKLLMLIFGICTFFLLVKKSGIADEVKDLPTLIWFVAVVLFFLSQPIYRSMMVRPFIFGTLFLAYSTGEKGLVKGALSAALLTFFYPYLSWFYILPAAFCHWIRGCRKFAVGSFVFLICFLILQPYEFWCLQKALIDSGSVRSQLGSSISELTFAFSHFFTVCYFCLVLAAYPFFSHHAKKLSYTCLLVLIYLPPAALYVRTFLDVFLPLVFIAYGRELFSVLKNWISILILKWRDLYLASIPANVGALFVRFSELNSPGGRSIPFRIVLAGGFLVLFYLAFVTCKSQFDSLKNIQASLSNLPAGATVLTSFNQQYRVLFLRPDLKMVPSSEIGFPTASIRDAYIKFFKYGSFKGLAEQTGASFLIEARDIYLDPVEAPILQPVKIESDLRVWKIMAD